MHLKWSAYHKQWLFLTATGLLQTCVCWVVACHCLHSQTCSLCDKLCLKGKGLWCVCACVCVNDSHISAISWDHPHLQHQLSADGALVYCLWSFLTYRPQVLLLLRCRPETDIQRHGCDTYMRGPAQTLFGCSFGACQLPRTLIPSGSCGALPVPSPCNALLLLPAPSPPSLPPPPQQRTPRNSGKDTALAQKPQMPWMMALLGAK